MEQPEGSHQELPVVDVQPPDVRPPRFHRTPGKAAIVCSILLGIFLSLLAYWSKEGGSTKVRFVIQGDSCSFFLDGRLIAHERIEQPWSEGGIGYGQLRKTVPVIAHDQCLRSLEITDSNTGEVLYRTDFTAIVPDLKKWKKTPDAWIQTEHGLTSGNREARLLIEGSWKDITVDMVIDNLTGGQFYFKVRDEENYLCSFFRPFRDFDFRFFVIKNGLKTRQTDNRTTVLSPIQTLKRTGDLVLHSWSRVLVVILGLILAALIIMLILIFTRGGEGTSEGKEGAIIAFNRLVDLIVNSRLWLGLAGILTILSFLWFLHVTDFYLERIPHVQDSATMLFQGKILATGRLWVPIPPAKDHFNLSGFFHFKNGRMFGQYPPGHPLFLAIGVLLRAPWIMPALAGSLLVLIVFYIGRRIISAPWGLLGAFLLFSSPFFQMTAPNFMSHVTASLYLGISFLCLLKMEEDRSRWVVPIVGGLFLGLLLHTRPMTAIAVGVIYFHYFFLLLILSGEKKRLLVRITAFTTTFIFMAILFLIYNWLLMDEPFAFTYGETAKKVIGQAFNQTRFDKAILDNFTLVALFLMVVTGWKMPVTALFLLAGILPDKKSKRSLLLIVVLIVAVFLAYMFYSISSVTVMYGPRYVSEITFLFILAIVSGGAILARSVTLLAHAVAWCLLRGTKLKDRLQNPATVIFTGRIMAGLVYYFIAMIALICFVRWAVLDSRPWPGNTYVPQNVSELKGFNHISPKIQTMIARQGITNAVVFVGADPGQAGQWWHYGSVFFENSPLFDGNIVYAKDLGDAMNRDLMAYFPGKSYYRAHYEKGTLVKQTALATQPAPEDSPPQKK